jgi:GntR family transcriptional regulator/MocR family aminotransferase
MTIRFRADSPAIALDRRSDLPLFRQLYEGYRKLILTGQLRPDSQLPSSRDLAKSLRVSRNTVLNALEQLIAEGYLYGKVGAGTFVSDLPSTKAHRQPRGVDLEEQPDLSWEAQRSLGYIVVPPPAKIKPFWSGVPALDKFPLGVWSRLASRQIRKAKSSDLHYSDPAGSARFRTLVAQYLREFRAVQCEADQILIVSGSQQALYLIARVLLNRGDSVAIEEPNYPGARHALSAGGADLLPVPVDNEGLRISELATLKSRVRAVYVTPSHQCPLGMTMPLPRRLQLLDWAATASAWIIEDDFDSEYRYTSRPLSSLQGLDHSERVIYLGTFSKVMFPGLRLGYVVLPRHLVRPFCAARQVIDFCPPQLSQAVMSDFMEEGLFVRHIKRMRRIHHERQKAMLTALRRQFGSRLEVTNTDSGLNLVVWLPAGVNDVEAQQMAWDRGVYTFPLSSIFYMTRLSRSGLFLGFAGCTPAQIREGVKQLGNALSEIGV